MSKPDLITFGCRLNTVESEVMAQRATEAGLEILENDHAALDGILDSFTRNANRVIKLVHLDEAQAREEAGTVLDGATQIEKLLERHLGDEEDLAVPIILHHKLRG